MDGQVLEAEIVEEWPGKKSDATRSLNAALGATIAVVLVFLLMSRVIGAPLEEQAIERANTKITTKFFSRNLLR